MSGRTIRIAAMVFCAAFWLLLAVAAHAYIERPPERYQGDSVQMVKFMDPDKISDYCLAWGGKLRPQDRYLLACFIPQLNVVVLPNGCRKSGEYAELTCHEVAHAQDWPVDHPEK